MFRLPLVAHAASIGRGGELVAADENPGMLGLLPVRDYLKIIDRNKARPDGRPRPVSPEARHTLVKPADVAEIMGHW
jgi:hypothetical protein